MKKLFLAGLLILVFSAYGRADLFLSGGAGSFYPLAKPVFQFGSTGSSLVPKAFLPDSFSPSPERAKVSAVDSLRRRLSGLQGLEKHFALVRIAFVTNAIHDWDAVVANAAMQKDTVSLCMGLTNRIVCLSNTDATGRLPEEVRRSLPFMRAARQYYYYFFTYQTYINYLFGKRRYDEAKQAATDMFGAAQAENRPEGMAMALQIQGSIYYRLGLYRKAMETLEEGFRICPSYENKENQTLAVSATIYEWLCMTALKTGDTEKLAAYADCYEKLVDYRNRIGMDDPSGHYPVTAAAFRARVFLKAGDLPEAGHILDRAASLIRPGLPARAYEHYYEARCRLLYRQGDYRRALAIADTLLSTHQGYFPFYLDDMLRKAEILTRLGHVNESTGLYLRYIQLKDSMDRVEIAEQMDKLRTLYQVDRLKTEERNSWQRFLIAISWGALVTLICIGYVVYSRRLHKKNRILYLRIREQEEMEQRVLDAIEVLPVDSLPKETQLFCRLSEIMQEQKLFTDPELKRKDVADLLGTNETYLANAIRTSTDGKTYREYITDLRLKYASKRLVESGDRPVEIIGEEAGFNSRSTFYRVFRERFGMSPSDFRLASRDK